MNEPALPTQTPAAWTTWRTVWQAELLTILRRYRQFREHNAYFFLRLLVFFFAVNAICYWLAVLASFPELLTSQLGRMLTIQQPVALLGGLFDSLSFFITVWLVGKAARSETGTRFIGILSIDLLIAAVATAWVLFAVMLSSWMIGPPTIAPGAAQQPAVIVTTVEIDPQQTDPDSSTDDTTAEAAASGSSEEEVAPPGVEAVSTAAVVTEEEADIAGLEQNIAAAEAEQFSTAFYQNLLVSALQNPLDNIRYFLFAIIMGVSTLLPTLFHIYMGSRTYALMRAP